MATRKAQVKMEEEASGNVEKEDKGQLYRIPPINLNTKEDAELIEALDRMRKAGGFKSNSDLVRKIVRVAVPAFEEHPYFSNSVASQNLLTPNQGLLTGGLSITTSNSDEVQW